MSNDYKLEELFQHWQTKHAAAEALIGKYFVAGSEAPVRKPELSLAVEAIQEIAHARAEEEEAWQAYVDAARS